MGGLVQVDAEVVRVGGRVDRADGHAIQLQRRCRVPLAPRLGRLLNVERVQPTGGLPAGSDPDVVGARRERALIHESGVGDDERIEAVHRIAAGVQDLARDPAGALHDHLGLFGEGEREPVDVFLRVDQPVVPSAHIDGLGVARAGGVGDPYGLEDVVADGVVVAGDFDVVEARRQGFPDDEVVGTVGRVAVVVLGDHGAVGVEEFPDGVGGALCEHDHARWRGQLEFEVVDVVAGVDPPAHAGAQRQAGGAAPGVAVLRRGARGGGRPGRLAGGHRPDLEVVAGAVGQAMDNKMARSPGPCPLYHSPVGVRRLARAGFGIAHVIGRDGHPGRMGRLAPRDRDRTVAGDHRVDGRHTDPGCPHRRTRPGAVTDAVDGAHLHGIGDAAVEPSDGVLQSPRRPCLVHHSPVGVHRLVRAGLDVAQIVGGDPPPLGRRGPCDGERTGPRSDRGDHRSVWRLSLSTGVAVDQQHTRQRRRHDRHQPSPTAPRPCGAGLGIRRSVHQHPRRAWSVASWRREL